MKLKKYSRTLINLFIFSMGMGLGSLQVMLSSLVVDQNQPTVVKPLANNMAFLPVLSSPSSPKSPPTDGPIALKVSPPKATPPTPLLGSKKVQGGFRVSNRSPYPVRIAFLSRHSPKNQTDTPSAHWDFAPGEGSRQGLVLSLPDSPLKLQPGDILVAFAQDGSRRYWGPYIVGESTAPIWNPQSQEWQFIIQP